MRIPRHQRASFFLLIMAVVLVCDLAQAAPMDHHAEGYFYEVAESHAINPLNTQYRHCAPEISVEKHPEFVAAIQVHHTRLSSTRVDTFRQVLEQHQRCLDRHLLLSVFQI